MAERDAGDDLTAMIAEVDGVLANLAAVGLGEGEAAYDAVASYRETLVEWRGDEDAEVAGA